MYCFAFGNCWKKIVFIKIFLNLILEKKFICRIKIIVVKDTIHKQLMASIKSNQTIYYDILFGVKEEKKKNHFLFEDIL